MATMKKAVQFARTGNPPDVVEVIDMETAPVGPGDVLIDVEAASINPSHLLTLSGGYGIQPEWLREDLQSLPRPDVILVTSMMTYWYTGVQETIGVLRDIFADVPLILGGIYATLCREHFRLAQQVGIDLQGDVLLHEQTTADHCRVSRAPSARVQPP